MQEMEQQFPDEEQIDTLDICVRKEKLERQAKTLFFKPGRDDQPQRRKKEETGDSFFQTFLFIFLFMLQTFADIVCK